MRTLTKRLTMLLVHIFNDPKAPSAFMAAMADISLFEKEKALLLQKEESQKQNAFEESLKTSKS